MKEEAGWDTPADLADDIYSATDRQASWLVIYIFKKIPSHPLQTRHWSAHLQIHTQIYSTDDDDDDGVAALLWDRGERLSRYPVIFSFPQRLSLDSSRGVLPTQGDLTVRSAPFSTRNLMLSSLPKRKAQNIGAPMEPFLGLPLLSGSLMSTPNSNSRVMTRVSRESVATAWCRGRLHLRRAPRARSLSNISTVLHMAARSRRVPPSWSMPVSEQPRFGSAP